VNAAAALHHVIVIAAASKPPRCSARFISRTWLPIVT